MSMTHFVPLLGSFSEAVRDGKASTGLRPRMPEGATLIAQQQLVLKDEESQENATRMHRLALQTLSYILHQVSVLYLISMRVSSSARG